jgi:lipoprotein-releasing system permease protein
MPYELFLALRYLRSRRRRGGGPASARVTALVAVVGVACGVAALVVAMALANGFRDEMRDKILRGTAHVTLARADGGAVADWRALAARVRGVEGVTEVEPTTYAGALLGGPGGGAYAVVRGIDASSSRALAEVQRTLTAGAPESLFQTGPADVTPGGRVVDEKSDATKLHPIDPDGPRPFDPNGMRPADDPRSNADAALPVIVGAELAARAGLRAVGDEGWLVLGEMSPSTAGFGTRTRRVRLAGLFRSGLHEYDSTWVYASLADAADLAGAGGAGGAAVLSVETSDIYRANEVAARLRETLGADFTVVDWQEANRPLFAALELERRTVALIVALIVVVAALNITTTLVLVVVERRADIAVLGAMGARARSVMAIFVCEGAIIGAAGALAGLVLGLAACVVGERYKLVRLPAEVYSLDSIPFHPRASETALAALAAFVVCLVATLYPARKAARTRPAEALRYE